MAYKQKLNYVCRASNSHSSFGNIIIPKSYLITEQEQRLSILYHLIQTLFELVFICIVIEGYTHKPALLRLPLSFKL